MEVYQEVRVVYLSRELVGPDETMLTIEDTCGSQDAGIYIAKLPVAFCIEAFDSGDEEEVLCIRDASSRRHTERFRINTAILNDKVIGVLMVLIFVQSNPQVTATISRAAVDCIGEVLTDLIEGFSQVVARFLGVRKDGCRN